MFEIIKRSKLTPRYLPNAFAIRDKRTNQYLHSDGAVYDNQYAEWWPTEEQAQAVLDKYPPKHVWVHGDVFRWDESDGYWSVMIHLKLADGPVVYCLMDIFRRDANYHPALADPSPEYLLANATFLFNIKTVIKDIL